MRTKIIYEDKHILVCYKPAGLATQTAKVGQQDMVSELKNYLAVPRPYLGVIHRLDQPVEGLLVFAKDNKSAAKLTASLSQGTLNKQYYAVVCGQPPKKEAQLVDYLVRDPVTGSAKVVTEVQTEKDDNREKKHDNPVGENGRPGKEQNVQKAVLQYRVLKQCAITAGSVPEPADASCAASQDLYTSQAITLLDIHIDTGRFHQIRAQMAHAGLPLLGDSRYGDEISGQISRQLGVRNVALCAYRIDLKHPVTGQKLKFEIEPEGKIFKVE